MKSKIHLGPLEIIPEKEDLNKVKNGIQQFHSKRKNKRREWKQIGLYFTPPGQDDYIYQIGWVNLSSNDIQEILEEGMPSKYVGWPTIEEIFGEDVVKDCTDPNSGEECFSNGQIYLIKVD